MDLRRRLVADGTVREQAEICLRWIGEAASRRHGNGLQAQHFPQPFGEPFRHPLEAEVVGMSTIHQTVYPGRT